MRFSQPLIACSVAKRNSQRNPQVDNALHVPDRAHIDRAGATRGM